MARRIETRFARLQASMVILLCAAGVVASLQDIGVQATRLGWLSDEVGSWFVGRVHAVIVVTGLFVVPVLVILRKLTVEFAEAGVGDRCAGEPAARRSDHGVGGSDAPRNRGGDSDRRGKGVGSTARRPPVHPASTAATHVRNIMRKTEIKRRTDLTLLAVVDWDDRS